MKDLSHYRKSYEKSALLEQDIPKDPINLFHRWFHEVQDFGGIDEVNAMTVATQGLDGFPKARVVLLKQYNEEGFVFYTNYESEKGKAIATNPKVCLAFFWNSMERQVIIKGTAVKLSAEQSDDYFYSRPLGSQLGAIVSPQSSIIPNRTILENQLHLLEQQHNQEVQRPTNWGGYRVEPISVEFWQGRPNRLHDRIRYTIQDDLSWSIDRLAP